MAGIGRSGTDAAAARQRLGELIGDCCPAEVGTNVRRGGLSDLRRARGRLQQRDDGVGERGGIVGQHDVRVRSRTSSPSAPIVVEITARSIPIAS